VHERSSASFLAAMAQEACYGFSVGDPRFIAMNAFDCQTPNRLLCCRSRWSGSDTSLKRLVYETDKGSAPALLSQRSKGGVRNYGNSCAITVCG
jgi:hypothetical protein